MPAKKKKTVKRNTIKHVPKQEALAAQPAQPLPLPPPLPEQPARKGVFSTIVSKLRREEPYSSTLPQQIAAEKELPNTIAPAASTQAELERIKATLQALTETRKTTNERFLHLAEELGGVRQSLLNQQHEMRELELHASKAVDAVASVQPEKLYAETKRLEAKFVAYDARLESHKQLIDKSFTELRDIRTRMALFKGVEQTLKLNEEITNKLTDLQKLHDAVERHAEKTENVFVEVQEKFSRFEQFEKTGKAAERAQAELLAEFDKLKVHTANFVTKKDLEAAEEELAQSAEFAVSTVSELKKEFAKMHTTAKDAPDALQKALRELEEQVHALKASPPNDDVRVLRSIIAQQNAAIESHTVQIQQLVSAIKAREASTPAAQQELQRVYSALAQQDARLALLEAAFAQKTSPALQMQPVRAPEPVKTVAPLSQDAVTQLAHYIQTTLKPAFSDEQLYQLLSYEYPPEVITAALALARPKAHTAKH